MISVCKKQKTKRNQLWAKYVNAFGVLKGTLMQIWKSAYMFGSIKKS